MKMTNWSVAACLGICLMLGACSSENEGMPMPEGKGAVKLSLTADMGFKAQTKAVNEDTYVKDHLDDYTVRILSDNGKPVSGCEWKKSELPTDLIELGNGSYKVEAFYGEEYNASAATRQGIYMYGSKSFDVNDNQTETVAVNCRPACGKLQVVFGENMPKYFSDYSVSFKTVAAGEGGSFIWSKGDTDPLYVKLKEAGETVSATFNIIKSDGTKANVNALNRLMKWGTSWTITVNPKVEDNTGKLGITITFDDKTDNKYEYIDIPFDWLK